MTLQSIFNTCRQSGDQYGVSRAPPFGAHQKELPLSAPPSLPLPFPYFLYFPVAPLIHGKDPEFFHNDRSPLLTSKNVP